MLCAGLVLQGAPSANWSHAPRPQRSRGRRGRERREQARDRSGLTRAADYVARLPKPVKGAALAAHATPEGHWKFVSREGEVFTAGNADELARVRSVLAPRPLPVTSSRFISPRTRSLPSARC